MPIFHQRIHAERKTQKSLQQISQWHGHHLLGSIHSYLYNLHFLLGYSMIILMFSSLGLHFLVMFFQLEVDSVTIVISLGASKTWQLSLRDI